MYIYTKYGSIKLESEYTNINYTSVLSLSKMIAVRLKCINLRNVHYYSIVYTTVVPVLYRPICVKVRYEYVYYLKWRLSVWNEIKNWNLFIFKTWQINYGNQRGKKYWMRQIAFDKVGCLCRLALMVCSLIFKRKRAKTPAL